MWYLTFVLLRLLVILFFVATSTYSVLNYTPFVFYQFIRPRIFGWVNQFVAWHHLWYCAAYALSVISLVPDLKRPASNDSRAVWTRRLVLAYIVVFGLVAEWLVVTPYLPTLWNDRRSFVAALLSFLPVLWLAAIDHGAVRFSGSIDAGGTAASRSTVARSGESEEGSAGTASPPVAASDQRRLLAACALTAVYSWLVHLLWASFGSGADASSGFEILQAGWALSLNLTAAMLLYAVLNGIAAVAGRSRTPPLWEYLMALALAGVAIAAFLMKEVFPTIAFGRWEPPALAMVAGFTLALAWSGMALRRGRPGPWLAGGLDRLLAPLMSNRTWRPALALVVLPLCTFAVLHAVERADWNFLLQKTVVVIEWVIAFGLIWGMTRRMTPAVWSPVRAVVPPAVAVLALVLLARALPAASAWTHGSRTDTELALDRYAGRDVSFRILYDALVTRPAQDATFSRYLQINSTVSTKLELTPPDVRFSPALTMTAGVRPHIFLFVLDSLRRDYLSPFNPAVSFTPNIASFAGEGFAFRNAFTHYGGTAIAVPSIWSGGLLLHRLYMPEFPRLNGLEKLLAADRYRWYMSLDTHMAPLISPHPDLVRLDSDRDVMQFDFCRTLGELEADVRARTDGRPVFAFTLPQNLHISNRQHGAVPPGERYPGFFEPYAAEVHRIDACFGEFIASLKRTGMYDDSIIVLTTDHGDSLGEGGNWGHGVTLYPEVVRIPLVIHIPDSLKAGLTTDLTRVAFSTDIVPTLYALLGHETRNLGPLYGSPLFAAADGELVERPRGSFLLASSYAATWGMLRRNGRSLYIADLVNGREYAYDLTSSLAGTAVQVTDEIRDVNQRLMREQIAALAALYQFTPGP